MPLYPVYPVHGQLAYLHGAKWRGDGLGPQKVCREPAENHEPQSLAGQVVTDDLELLERSF